MVLLQICSNANIPNYYRDVFLVNKMKMGRRSALIGITILLCSFIFVTVEVQAKKPIRTELTFEYIWTGFGEHKKEWTTNNGIYHTLQTPHYGEVISGDIVGDIYYCGNLILDLATYSGKGGGVFEFTGEYEGEPAGFKGKLLFEIEFGVVFGTLNCPGTGAFENILLKGTIDSVLGGSTLVSLILWT